MKYTEKEALELCAQMCQNSLMETLEIEFTAIGDDFLTAKMPVSPKVHQPDGVLHGGASVALAESVGSAASFIFLDGDNFFVRGIEISANHIRSVSEGFVFAKAEILHKGRTTQVWDIKIRNEQDKLISAVKLTTIALPKKPAPSNFPKGEG